MSLLVDYCHFCIEFCFLFFFLFHNFILLKSNLDLVFIFFFFFSSRRRHTRLVSDWSSDVCSSDLARQQWAGWLDRDRSAGFGCSTGGSSLQGDIDKDLGFTVPSWTTPQVPLKSLFGRRLHGGLPSLPGLRSTGSCPYRSCRPTCLQAGSARWCLSSRWRWSPGPSLLSPGPVRTSPPTCRPPPSSRADRTASRATPSTSACSWV